MSAPHEEGRGAVPGMGAGRPRRRVTWGFCLRRPPEDEVAMCLSVNGMLPAGLACALRSGNGGCCAMGVGHRGIWAVRATPCSGSRFGLHLHRNSDRNGTVLCHRYGARFRLLTNTRPGDSPRYCRVLHRLWYSEGPWPSKTAPPPTYVRPSLYNTQSVAATDLSLFA